MTEPTLVMVSGSRGWTDRDAIEDAFVDWYGRMAYFTDIDEVTLLHGDANGADRLAADVARELGWQVEAVPADWDGHGKRAGIIRNLAMLDRDPAHVFIFWDGLSRGTKHVIDQVQSGRRSYQIERGSSFVAVRSGMPREEHLAEGEAVDG